MILMQMILTIQQIASRLTYPHTICQKSQVTLASWIPLLHILTDIRRKTTQFSKYRTVDAYAETADAQSTHCADADVATVARSGLTRQNHLGVAASIGYTTPKSVRLINMKTSYKTTSLFWYKMFKHLTIINIIMNFTKHIKWHSL